jgi:hypothetical protein
LLEDIKKGIDILYRLNKLYNRDNNTIIKVIDGKFYISRVRRNSSGKTYLESHYIEYPLEYLEDIKSYMIKKTLTNK